MKKSFLPLTASLLLLSLGFLLTSRRIVLASVVVLPDGSVNLKSGGQVLGETTKKPEAPESVEPKEAKEAPEPKKPEVESQSGSQVQVETQTEGGHSQTEIQQGDVKIKIEKENGRFQLQMENSSGQVTSKIEPTGEDLLQIKERNGSNEVKVSTSSAGLLTISRNRFGAATALPLSVDLKTNQLTVTTPAGSKSVAVLPDVAVQNIISQNLLSAIGSLPIPELLSRSSPSALMVSHVTLVSGGGNQPVYEVSGETTFRIFGFLPVSMPRTVTVSAVTGAVEQVQQSFLSRLLGLISR